MEFNAKFGPGAQTPAQRHSVLQRMLDAIPTLRSKATPDIHQLYHRYVAGELSWSEVCEVRDATSRRQLGSL